MQPYGGQGYGAPPAGADAAYGMAANMAKSGAQAAASGINAMAGELDAQIKQGNDGLSILSFFAEVAVFVCAVLGMLQLGDIIFSPIHFAVNIYQLCFSVVGICLEAPETLVQKVPHIDQARGILFEYAKFLTELWGRGAFYMFQGGLAMTHVHVMYEMMGFIMLVVGILTIVVMFSPEAGKKVVRIGVSGVQKATGGGQYDAAYQPVQNPQMGR
jgi:hypothetical protein